MTAGRQNPTRVPAATPSRMQIRCSIIARALAWKGVEEELNQALRAGGLVWGGKVPVPHNPAAEGLKQQPTRVTRLEVGVLADGRGPHAEILRWAMSATVSQNVHRIT